MNEPAFVSNAQNGEDVVLWRALGDLPQGRYVEVGANHPQVDSVSRAFYDRGWSGVCVEPLPTFAGKLRAARPRDTVVEAAVLDTDEDSVLLHTIEGTGLSSTVSAIGRRHAEQGRQVDDVRVPARRLDDVLAEHDEGEVHFLLVDTEGAEASVLASIDLRRWRPWVLVVEATAPNSTVPTHEVWEPGVLAAGYELCLFDGLSRFYVAAEHADRLRDRLSFPACALDSFVTRRTADLERDLATLGEEREVLLAELVRWRGRVLQRWTQAAHAALEAPGAGGHPGHEAARLRAELEAVQHTVSWRVTRPLRAVRAAQLLRSPRR